IPYQGLQKALIRGQIVRVGTGEAIPGARVTITAESGKDRTVNANQAGEFVFTDLDAGTYRLSAMAMGYSRRHYGERLASGSGSLGTALDVAAGQQVTDIQIELIPYGEVSGRVRDSEGRPVSGLAVQLLKANYSATGHRSLEIVGTGKTDERGEYRIPSIPPRRYYLIVGLATALPRSRLPRTTGTSVDVDGAYALTYYPGVANPLEAVPIEVQPGQDLGGVDLSVYARETYRVRGRLVDSVTGQPPQTVAIALQPETLPDVIPSSRNLIYDAD